MLEVFFVLNTHFNHRENLTNSFMLLMFHQMRRDDVLLADNVRLRTPGERVSSNQLSGVFFIQVKSTRRQCPHENYLRFQLTAVRDALPSAETLKEMRKPRIVRCVKPPIERQDELVTKCITKCNKTNIEIQRFKQRSKRNTLSLSWTY